MNVANELSQMTPWIAGRGTVVFLRHGEREAVASHEFPRHDAPLTDNGRRSAWALGAMVGNRLGSVRSSPVPRCVETARHLLDGSGVRGPNIVEDERLGDPGAFIADAALALESLTHFGFHPAAKRVGDGEALPGFAHPDRAAASFVALAESALRSGPSRVHVLVTHDLMLSLFVARVIGRALAQDQWPGYLHGVAVWHGDYGLNLRYGTLDIALPDRLRAQPDR